MHEQSLMRALVARIDVLARERRASRVSKVVLRAGVLGHGDAGHLEDHFRRAARGTRAAHAALEVVNTEELIDLVLASVDLEASDE